KFIPTPWLRGEVLPVSVAIVLSASVAARPCHGSAVLLSQAGRLIEQGAARIPPSRIRSGAAAGAGGGASPAGPRSSAVRGGRSHHVGHHPASRRCHHDSRGRSRRRRLIIGTRWHVPSAAAVAG